MRGIAKIRTDILKTGARFWRGQIQVFSREECFKQIDSFGAPPADGQSLKHNDCAGSCEGSYANGYFKNRGSILARTDIEVFKGAFAGACVHGHPTPAGRGAVVLD